MTSAPDISLPRFEGPLDLLLELVRKNKIDITDIPIAEITRQYLEYFRSAQELDMDLGSEFAYIAALLIHIKSRCLVAADPETVGSEDDPRQELVRLLLDHEDLRSGAEFLKQKLEVAQASWSKSSLEEYQEAGEEGLPEQDDALNLLQVLRLAQQALDNARLFETVMPEESVSVEEMIQWLEDRLANGPGRIEAEPLLAEQPSFQHGAALFLAMLEMARATRIRLEQRECFGPLYIDATAQPCPNIEYRGLVRSCGESQC